MVYSPTEYFRINKIYLRGLLYTSVHVFYLVEKGSSNHSIDFAVETLMRSTFSWLYILQMYTVSWFSSGIRLFLCAYSTSYSTESLYRRVVLTRELVRWAATARLSIRNSRAIYDCGKLCNHAALSLTWPSSPLEFVSILELYIYIYREVNHYRADHFRSRICLALDRMHWVYRL